MKVRHTLWIILAITVGSSMWVGVRAETEPIEEEHANPPPWAATMLADHSDPALAWLLLGQAWNRAGYFREAESAFEEALGAGGDHPDLPRERALAALGQGRADEALDFLTDAPGDDAEAAYLRGLALYRLDRLAPAYEAFGRAMELDPRLEPEARGLRGAVLHAQGRWGEAWVESERALRAMGPELREEFLRLRPPPDPDRRLGGSVEAGVRYNDNVRLLPNDTTGLPPEFADEDDGLAFADLRLRADLSRTPDNRLRLVGSLLTTFHWDHHDVDLADALLALRWDRRIGFHQASLFAGGGHAWLGRRSWRATGLAGGGFTWRPDPLREVDVTYTLRHLDDLLGSEFDEENRTGWHHGLRLGPTFRSRDLRGALSLHGLADLADTRGDSVAHVAYGAEIQAAWSPDAAWTLSAGARHLYLDYDDHNVRRDFTETRRDDRWFFFAAAARRLSERWTLRADLQHLDNRSNIPEFFSYRQTQAGLSVKLDF